MDSSHHTTDSTLLPPVRAECAHQLTVVLDMDETMIHSEFATELRSTNARRYNKYIRYFRTHYQSQSKLHSVNDTKQCMTKVYRFQQPDRPFDMLLDIHFNTDQTHEYVFVHTRPHLTQFLRHLQDNKYEVIVFTAALPDYANAVLDAVDTNHCIQHRLYRQHTTKYNGLAYVKSLSGLGRDLRRVVLVDNNPLAMYAQPDNGIPIIDYYGGDVTRDDEMRYKSMSSESCKYQRDDCELLHILKLIDQLNGVQDVRLVLREVYGLHERLRLQS